MRRICILMLLIPVVLSACRSVAPTLTQEKMPAAPTLTPSIEPAAVLTPQESLDRFAAQREQMVVQTIERRGVEDERVLAAMRAVQRHLFVSNDLQGMAYEDHPLPIGYGQTISQPYIVAWMTEMLQLEEGARVLEIGTGSGYQAAVLAEMPGIEVYTIEIVPQLAQSAQERLRELGYTGIQAKQDDGYYGWPEHAPFDAIIVTAAPDHVPQPLIDQLAPGGRLVIPIGPPGSYQTLWQFVKDDSGGLQAHNLGGVSFVPFTGKGIEQEHPKLE